MRKMMKSFVLLLLVFSCFFVLSSMAGKDGVTVTVNSVISVGTTDDTFICATLDWWPENKCDYNQCPWGKAGLLNLDLNNKILFNAVKAFESMRIRIGGSLQDQIIYKVGSHKTCQPLVKNEGAMFAFDGGCFPMDRWDELNHFFNQTGVKLTFGLNALIGRQKTESTNDNLWVGDWDGQNARDFMAYTINKGYNIDSWELGNELSGTGVGARIEADQYAKDMIKLKNIVNELYPYPISQPKVLGPGGFYDERWYNVFLQMMGPGVIDGVTHHIYNLGAGVEKTLINKVQDPFFLDQIAQTFHDASRSVDLFSPMAETWVGESGGAYNSGGKDVSHTFANGFWFLDQLGMTSTFNHKVYCRQALIGGNYALLNTTSFIPNPDYYGALLWHRLMGRKVLSTTHNGSPFLRAYAHCAKNTNGITVLLINMSNSTSFEISVANDLNLYPGPGSEQSGTEREEYHLTPKGGNIQSDVVLLNGKPLKLTDSLDIPDLDPKLVDAVQPICVAPDSIVFATLKEFNAPVCA